MSEKQTANQNNQDNQKNPAREKLSRAEYGRILLQNGMIPDAVTLSEMNISRAEAQLIIARARINKI